MALDFLSQLQERLKNKTSTPDFLGQLQARLKPQAKVEPDLGLPEEEYSKELNQLRDTGRNFDQVSGAIHKDSRIKDKNRALQLAGPIFGVNKEKLGEFATKNLPGTIEKYASIQEDPLNLKADIRKVPKDFLTNLRSQLENQALSYAKVWEAGKGALKNKDSKSAQDLALKVAESLFGLVETAFAPLASAAQAVESVPVLGTGAKAYNAPYIAGGETVGGLATKGAEKLGASPEEQELAGRVGGLVGSAVAGGLIHGGAKLLEGKIKSTIEKSQFKNAYETSKQTFESRKTQNPDLYKISEDKMPYQADQNYALKDLETKLGRKPNAVETKAMYAAQNDLLARDFPASIEGRITNLTNQGVPHDQAIRIADGEIVPPKGVKMKVPIDKIKDVDGVLRLNPEEFGVALDKGLAEGLKSGKFPSTPIKVEKIPGTDFYKVIDGQHHLDSYKWNGNKFVEITGGETAPPIGVAKPLVNTKVQGSTDIIPKEIKEGVKNREGFINPQAKVGGAEFKGFNDITTSILDRLKGKTATSKQEILDFTNMPELRQAERDLIRRVANEYQGIIPVKEFANKVKTELLPLDVNIRENQYENIALPSELRGPIANYHENIYESPIKTSVGDVHYHGIDNYFAHTRIEDLPKNPNPKFRTTYGNEPVYGKTGDTRRVIELQSDLFQKGRLEEGGLTSMNEADKLGSTPANAKDMTNAEWKKLETQRKQVSQQATKEMSQLEPYRNTWHERVIREEVKQAAKDGKTKLQFPTGETAMKIEGLGETNRFLHRLPDGRLGPAVATDTLKVGDRISNGGNANDFIVTEILGEGKFKAILERTWEDNLNYSVKNAGVNRYESGRARKILSGEETPTKADYDLWGDNIEQFDISGKVDTSNPIYKFYEKEVRKFLQNKFDAKEITDPQGVRWIEVDIKPQMKKEPIKAFGMKPGKQIG